MAVAKDYYRTVPVFTTQYSRFWHSGSIALTDHAYVRADKFAVPAIADDANVSIIDRHKRSSNNHQIVLATLTTGFRLLTASFAAKGLAHHRALPIERAPSLTQK